MTGTEVATTSSGTLALRGDQTDWLPAQRAALDQIGIADAPLGDQQVFLHVAQRLGLDPFARQIYLIARKDRDSPTGKKWTIQTGIDGFRLFCERDKRYDGEGDPAVEWCGPDGVWHDVWTDNDNPPVAARFTVKRKDHANPVKAIAHYREYVQTKYDGEPNHMWKTKAAGQLAKCFDDETEVLTEYGYRKFADVGGARIMQVTGGGLEAVAAAPFVRDYDGLMVTLNSDDLNFSVTPNHDMITTFGVVEASAMYATALARATWRIPRLAPPATGPGLDLSNDAIQIAAAIVADGTRHNKTGWRIEVSRPAKINALDSLGLAVDHYIRSSRGDEATSKRSGRVIRSNFDKRGYRYSQDTVSALIDDGKHLRTAALLSMNTKQAQLLVDTLIEFDGTTNRKTGVRRFLTSDRATLSAFELASSIAGYTVNTPTPRYSDLSDRPNWWITISHRDEIGFIRASDGRTSLQMVPNQSGRVWCVTVPSGRIMVRRHGFAMVCGNCAEALARRRLFPQDLSGVYTDDEMAHLDSPPPTIIQSEREPAAEPDWDTLITAAENRQDRPELKKIWDLARGLRPNDMPLRDRIASAGTRVKAATEAKQQPQPAPEQPAAVNVCVVDESGGTEPAAAEKSQKNRLFALLRDGGISGSDRAVRLRIVGRVLNRPPAQPVASFDELNVSEIDTINTFLQRCKDNNTLEVTLADLGSAEESEAAAGG